MVVCLDCFVSFLGHTSEMSVVDNLTVFCVNLKVAKMSLFVDSRELAALRFENKVHSIKAKRK